MNMPDPRVDQMAYYHWMLKRLQHLSEAYPGAAEAVRPLIEYREQQIAALEAVDAAIEAVDQAPTGQGTMEYQRVTTGYRKDATGAMQPRTHVLHITTGPPQPSSAFWPDLSAHRTRTNSRDA